MGTESNCITVAPLADVTVSTISSSLRTGFNDFMAFDTFKECFDATTNDRNSDATGSKWVICNQKQTTLDGPDAYSQVCGATSFDDQNVACVGEDSCTSKNIGGTKDDIVVCTGESSCEDATGIERDDRLDTETSFGYFCGGKEGESPVVERDACRGMTIKDNTLCASETSCEDA